MGQNSSKAGVVVWGNPDYGQLGIGSASAEQASGYIPPRLLEKIHNNVQTLTAGGHHSVAVTESFEVMTLCFRRISFLGQIL